MSSEIRNREYAGQNTRKKRKEVPPSSNLAHFFEIIWWKKMTKKDTQRIKREAQKHT